MSRKVLLVDLGSVVIQPRLDIMARTLLDYYRGPRDNLTPLNFIKPLRVSYRYIEEFDLGHITPFEFYCLVTDLLQLERRDISYPLFRRIYGEERANLNEPMVKFLETDQMKNVRKIIASNINDISWSGIQKLHSERFSHIFEDAVLSHIVRRRKPEVEFWIECANLANQRIDMLHLVDDLNINTESLRRQGGKVVQYDLNDHDTGERKIKAMLFPFEY